jgi:hypothetical protein
MDFGRSATVLKASRSRWNSQPNSSDLDGPGIRRCCGWSATQPRSGRYFSGPARGPLRVPLRQNAVALMERVRVGMIRGHGEQNKPGTWLTL